MSSSPAHSVLAVAHSSCSAHAPSTPPFGDHVSVYHHPVFPFASMPLLVGCSSSPRPIPSTSATSIFFPASFHIALTSSASLLSNDTALFPNCPGSDDGAAPPVQRPLTLHRHSSTEQARPCLFACSSSPAPDSIHGSYVPFLPCVLPHRAHLVCLPALQRRHRVSLQFVHVVCSPSSSSCTAVLCPTAPPDVFDVDDIRLHPTRCVHTVSVSLRSRCRLSLSESLPSSALPSVLMWLAGWLPHCAFSRSRPSEPVPSRSHVRTDYPSSPAALWLAGYPCLSLSLLAGSLHSRCRPLSLNESLPSSALLSVLTILAALVLSALSLPRWLPGYIFMSLAGSLAGNLLPRSLPPYAHTVGPSLSESIPSCGLLSVLTIPPALVLSALSLCRSLAGYAFVWLACLQPPSSLVGWLDSRRRPLSLTESPILRSSVCTEYPTCPHAVGRFPSSLAGSLRSRCRPLSLSLSLLSSAPLSVLTISAALAVSALSLPRWLARALLAALCPLSCWLAAPMCLRCARPQAQLLFSFDAPFLTSSHAHHSLCLCLLLASACMLLFVSAQFDAPFVSSLHPFPLLAAHLPSRLPQRPSPLSLRSCQLPPIGSAVLPVSTVFSVPRWLAGWHDARSLRMLAVLAVAMPSVSHAYAPCHAVLPTALPMHFMTCLPPSSHPSCCLYCPLRTQSSITYSHCIASYGSSTLLNT